jgi:hypothetical protein
MREPMAPKGSVLSCSAEHEDGNDEHGGDDDSADDLLDLSVHGVLSFLARGCGWEA